MTGLAAVDFQPALRGVPSVVPIIEVPEASEGVTLEHGETMVAGARGISLYTQWWRPCGAARGAVIVVHGLKDHSARYGAFAERLVAGGFAVYAFDLRGHARSAGARGWVESFDEYLRDLDAIVNRAVRRERTAPVFLFGQGMGGTIAARWAIDRAAPLAGLVLSGASLQAQEAPAEAHATRLLAVLVPRARILQIDLRRACRDRGTVEDSLRDALVQQAPAPARTARELLDAMARVDARAAQLKVPLLAMHGSADVPEDPEGSRRIVARAGSRDKQVYVYDGLAHDLLHEPERARVTSDVAAWLDDRAR
jgi:acylglycerol lipase